MSGEYWARQASWYQRRYTPVARMANAFYARKPPSNPLRICRGHGCPGCPAIDCWNEVPGLCAGDKCPGCKTCWNEHLDANTAPHHFAPPTKEPMNDSLKLAYTLNLTTWTTVAALAGNKASTQDILTIAIANIETLKALIEPPKKD